MHFCFTLLDFKFLKNRRETETETETWVCCATYLRIHQLILLSVP